MSTHTRSLSDEVRVSDRGLTAQSAPKPGIVSGRHDTAERKQALRKQREKGCSIYIAAEQLEKAGVDPNGPAPFYRVWAGERGRFIVTLYGAK